MRNRILLSSALFLVMSAAVISPRTGHAQSAPISGAVQNFKVSTDPRLASQIPFQNSRGKAQTFAKFRGKVVLVNFWATWCLGSKQEIPTLQRLQAKLGGKSFDVVLMSQDIDGWNAVNKFVKQRRVDIKESYLDEGMKLGRDLKLPLQMGSILIDAQGREVGRLIGHTDWDTPEARALIQHYIDKANKEQQS